MLTITHSVQFSHSVLSDSETLWTAARQASLSVTNCQSSLRLMFFESVMPSNHLILCRHLLLLPSIFPSIRVFSNESALCIRWPKIWSFSFNISPSNGHSGLISFRADWFDLLAVQGTLKSLLQHSFIFVLFLPRMLATGPLNFFRFLIHHPASETCLLYSVWSTSLSTLFLWFTLSES